MSNYNVKSLLDIIDCCYFSGNDEWLSSLSEADEQLAVQLINEPNPKELDIKRVSEIILFGNKNIQAPEKTYIQLKKAAHYRRIINQILIKHNIIRKAFFNESIQSIDDTLCAPKLKLLFQSFYISLVDTIYETIRDSEIDNLTTGYGDFKRNLPKNPKIDESKIIELFNSKTKEDLQTSLDNLGFTNYDLDTLYKYTNNTKSEKFLSLNMQLLDALDKQNPDTNDEELKNEIRPPIQDAGMPNLIMLLKSKLKTDDDYDCVYKLILNNNKDELRKFGLNDDEVNFFEPVIKNLKIEFEKIQQIFQKYNPEIKPKDILLICFTKENFREEAVVNLCNKLTKSDKDKILLYIKNFKLIYDKNLVSRSFPEDKLNSITSSLIKAQKLLIEAARLSVEEVTSYKLREKEEGSSGFRIYLGPHGVKKVVKTGYVPPLQPEQK